MAISLTKVYQALKETVENDLAKAIQQEQKFLKTLKIDTEYFGGGGGSLGVGNGSRRVTFKTALGGAVANSYSAITHSKLSANSASSAPHAMHLNYGVNYARIDMESEALRAMRTDKHSLIRGMEPFVGDVKIKFKDALGRLVWNGSDRSSGTVASVSTKYVTLSNRRDARNFQIGTAYEFYVSTLCVGRVVCTGINHQTGVIELSTSLAADFASENTYSFPGSGNADLIAAYANDYEFADVNQITNGVKIYEQGQFEAGATGTSSTAADWDIQGMSKWIPTASEFAAETAFFGRDRRKHRIALAGWYKDASSSTVADGIYDTLVDMSYFVNSSEGDVKIWVSPARYASIVRANSNVSTTMTYSEARKFGGVEGALTFLGPDGLIQVDTDVNISDNEAWIINSGSWLIGAMGPIPHAAEEVMQDGNFGSGAHFGFDGKFFMARAYWQLVCKDPTKNARITLPTLT